jgi:hypothetical protein
VLARAGVLEDNTPRDASPMRVPAHAIEPITRARLVEVNILNISYLVVGYLLAAIWAALLNRTELTGRRAPQVEKEPRSRSA